MDLLFLVLIFFIFFIMIFFVPYVIKEHKLKYMNEELNTNRFHIPTLETKEGGSSPREVPIPQRIGSKFQVEEP